MQKRKKAFFVLYLLIVVKLVVFKYSKEHLQAIVNSWEKNVILEGLKTANFTPFKTIQMYIDYSYMLNSFENLVGNVVLFIPFGFMLPFAFKRGNHFFVMLSSAFIFVAGIEVFQLFSAFGAFDVDDILLNCFGAVVGYLLFIIYKKIQTKRGK